MFRRRSSREKVGPARAQLRKDSAKNVLAADSVINDASAEDSLVVAVENSLFKHGDTGGYKRETEEESVSLSIATGH